MRITPLAECTRSLEAGTTDSGILLLIDLLRRDKHLSPQRLAMCTVDRIASPLSQYLQVPFPEIGMTTRIRHLELLRYVSCEEVTSEGHCQLLTAASRWEYALGIVHGPSVGFLQARFAVAVSTSRNSLDESVFEIRHANRAAGFSSCIGMEMVSEPLDTLQMLVGNETGNGKRETRTCSK